MARYPLLFGFTDRIAGHGFWARVTLEGRGLLVQEEDGYWMYGVNPGGVAGGGESPGEAQSKFREVYRSVLFDIAGEAASFADFRREVGKLFETNDANLAEWEEAVAEVRAGTVTADWLTRRPAESKRGIEVVEVKEPSPSENQMDEPLEVAA